MFDLDPLAHSIDVSKSSHRLAAPKIELKLAKKVQGIKWGKIEGEEEAATLPGMGEYTLSFSVTLEVPQERVQQ